MIRTTRTQHQSRQIFGINITPLTDVCLVLLIIFMVTAPALLKKDDQGFKLPLPKAEQAKMLPSSPVIIRIEQGPQLFVNNTPATFETLEAELAAYPKDSEGNLIVTIKADENIPYRHVIKVIDIAGKAGASDTLLATQQPAVPAQSGYSPVEE